MNIDGECTFEIVGDDLDFQQIEKMLQMKASETVVKGQKVTGDFYALKTFWSYSLSIINDEKLCDTLKRLLKELLNKEQEIKIISAKYHIEIDLFLRSDYGQMGFMMDRECISMLSEIGVPVDFHILSFGMAE